MKSEALFNTDYTVDIWLVHGCYPKVVGHEPHDLEGVEINVKVTLFGGGQTWELGEKT